MDSLIQRTPKKRTLNLNFHIQTNFNLVSPNLKGLDLHGMKTRKPVFSFSRKDQV